MPGLCAYAITTKAARDGFVVNRGTYRAFIDHRIQRASHAECTDYVRGAVNFRCQHWLGQEVGWVAVNCGSVGWVVQWRNGAYDTESYAFGSSGTDGKYSVYGDWMEFSVCDDYQSSINIKSLSMGGNTWTDVGYVGESGVYEVC